MSRTRVLRAFIAPKTGVLGRGLEVRIQQYGFDQLRPSGVRAQKRTTALQR